MSAAVVLPLRSGCDHALEASHLLDAVRGMAERLEFFEAGCWWHEAVRSIDKVQDTRLQLELRKRAGELSEQIVEAERARACPVAAE
jgi:hypothetical protein